MKEKFEVLINKYVDKELTKSEKEELEKIMEKSSKLRNELKAHIYAHRMLLTLEATEISENITKEIIRKIKKNKRVKSDLVFFFSMLFILLLLLLPALFIPHLNISNNELFNINTIRGFKLLQIFSSTKKYFLELVLNRITILGLIVPILYLLYENLIIITRLKKLNSGKAIKH